MSGYGDSALELIGEALADGVDHAALLLRHSARTFKDGLHDLDNQLTDEGRALCHLFGRRLPRNLTLRAYASPAHRCLETAQLILEAHKPRAAQSPGTGRWRRSASSMRSIR